jgi:hypothetical protein
MERKARLGSRFILSAVVILIAMCLAAPAQEKDVEALRQRVLRASHLTRINDVEMKPWHLKVNFQLYDPTGNPSEAGTIEEWWGGLTLWKLRIESPSYTSTVIENRDGDFRIQGTGLIPLQLRAIESSVVYPMPMGEDLGKTTPRFSHVTFRKDSLECIQLEEPPMPLSLTPTFCFDRDSDVLRAIYSSKSRSVLRNRVEEFNGHSVARSITTETGKLKTAVSEVVDLTEISLTEDLFTPSVDMKKATDMHTLKVNSAR